MKDVNIISDDRMDTAKAAAYLHFKKCTLDVWRHLKKGPNYMKVGFRVYYRKADLDSWLANCMVRVGSGR